MSECFCFFDLGSFVLGLFVGFLFIGFMRIIKAIFEEYIEDKVNEFCKRK